MSSMYENFEFITAEILGEYFDSKGVIPHCSLCDNVHFTVPQVGMTGSVSCSMNIGPYVNVFKAESTYHKNTDNYYISIICKKCGNVMMIDTSQVLEWVKQKYPAIMGKDSNE
ncbi:hypothetical protein [Photorhabdus sp. RW14-46]|uniref:hypothetical protein n=1 Tax=Photorhabdus sp. RW14-46 TaxID=2100168 RepID=UPI0013F3C5FA|nr:hypothetical protein [Photorhabdus sp. RW14-46]NHB61237.1 hypothetical protein [Photorhabdus sp. RW14-46]